MGTVLPFPVKKKPEQTQEAERERKIAIAKLLADVVAKSRAPWERWSCDEAD
jgi:hypothetical protein